MNSVYGVIVRSQFQSYRKIDERVDGQTRNQVSRNAETPLVDSTWTQMGNPIWEHISERMVEFL